MDEPKRCEKCNSYLRHDAACFVCLWRAKAERDNESMRPDEQPADGMVYGEVTIKI